MSSLYVRDTLRGWCMDPGLGLMLPFFDTVNVEVKPPAPRWATVVFVSANNTPTTYCGGMEERGSFDYVALGVAGIGDRDLIAAAEHDVEILLQQSDPDGRFSLLWPSPPQDYLQAGSTPWYTVSMVVDYVFEHSRAALSSR